jgi:type IV pilus assembly protein PilB
MADVKGGVLPTSALNGRSDEEKARANADALGLPYEPLDEAPADPDLWGEVPLELLVRYSCVPVGREGERIVLAFGALDEPAHLDELEFLLERPVEALIAPADRVSALLKRHRGGELLLEQASEGLRLQFVDEDEEDVDVKTLPAESPIVRLVDSLVLGAIDRRASDIHVETKDREVLVKYRIDGVLYPAIEPLD